MTDAAAGISTRRHSFTPIAGHRFDVVWPELVQDLLFGKPGDSVDKVPVRVADQSLNVVCLFNDENSDIYLKDAPWLIELRPKGQCRLARVSQ